MKCDYGCGNDGKFTLNNGKFCCSEKYQSCPELKKKNSVGVKKSSNRTLWYENLPDTTKEKMAWSKGITLTPNEKIFVCNGTHSTDFVKKRIISSQLKLYKCDQCGIDEWFGSKITLELDHINGINNDHRLENLRFLCPNCHSLTDTWRGRNTNSGKVKVSDDELLTAYKKCGNIRRTLIEVGLAPKGANYSRVKKLVGL